MLLIYSLVKKVEYLSNIIVLVLIVLITFHIVPINQGFDAFLQISGLKKEYQQSLQLGDGFSC